MPMEWQELKDDWLAQESLAQALSDWAITPINEQEDSINSLELTKKQQSCIETNKSDIYTDLKALRSKVKSSLTSKEDSLDDLTLNAPNSYKLQISVPSNINYLMKAWAAAEGRDLSSVAMQCLEVGLREIKGKDGIPLSAVARYNSACEKRIALAEANDLWERIENHLKQI